MYNYVVDFSVATTQAQDQVESRLLLDVVIRERTAIFELLAGKDESLLIRGNAFLVLDLGLHILDGVRGLDIKSDGLASQRLDENLHATAETEDQVKGALLLNVVVAQSATVLKLLSSEDEALLVGRDALLVLNFGLDVLNRVGSLDVEGDCLAGESLNEDLHVDLFVLVLINNCRQGPAFIIFDISIFEYEFGPDLRLNDRWPVE